MYSILHYRKNVVGWLIQVARRLRLQIVLTPFISVVPRQSHGATAICLGCVA